MKLRALFAVTAALLLAGNVQAADHSSYTCAIGSIYLTGAGRSVDAEGETMKFSIKGDILTIENTSDGKTAHYDLKIQTHNNFAVLAKSESMLFSYRFGSGAFEWSTGIGKSGFDQDLGHKGNQARFAGACSAD